ncbi:MCP four helix bundle domain-containing protein, partial [Caloramator mitchellensis]|uniref:MCP four helix bundle domain-containing protein n=1 Tax=Caloramator mitchellensis TaxID=908809 RepID=UPI001364BD6B
MHKMPKTIKILNNIKIKNSVIILIATIEIFLILISLLAINNMKTLRNDINSLYNDRILPASELKKMEKEFYQIRLSFDQMLYSNNYDSSLEAQILWKNKNTDKILSKYKTFNLNDEQKKMVSLLENNYKLYIENILNITNKLKNKENISVEDISYYKDLNIKIEKSFADSIKFNDDIAAIVVNKSNVSFSKSINTFVYIFILITLFSVFLGLIIEKIIKNSLMKIKQVAERLSEYDFTIELDVEGKNELAQVNNLLKNIIENIKETLKQVQEKAVELTAHSENLLTNSEEMASSSQELAKTMQQVAEGSSSQASDLQDIVGLMSNLTDSIENVYKE